MARFHFPPLLLNTLLALLVLVAGCSSRPEQTRAGWATLDGQAPLVIAHRGASGELPEETLPAYTRAIELGADVIEMDLIATRDGVLITRHDADLGITTDIAGRPEFAARRSTQRIDGKSQTGWFAADFTLAEIQTLRARQPEASRPQQFNGLYAVPTFAQVLALADAAGKARGKPVAIYVETKSPAWHRTRGLPLEERVLAQLDAAGLNHAGAPVFLQSFDADSLKRLRAGGLKTSAVQLMGASADTSPAALAAIRAYAKGIGPSRRLLGGASTLVRDAHQAGLFVHPYTYNRADDDFDGAYRSGVDGVFTDFTAEALAARSGLASRSAPMR